MRHIFLLLTLFLVSCVSKAATTVTFTLQDFTTTAAASRKVLVTPLSFPEGGAAVIVSADKKLYTASTNGAFTITNMVGGIYQCELQAPPSVTKFWIDVPTNASAYNASALLVAATNTVPSGTMALTASTAAATYVAMDSGLATNLTVSNITVLGTYTGTAAGGQPASENLTNWAQIETNLVAYISQLGTAAYSNAAAFQPASDNLTSWAAVLVADYPTLTYLGNYYVDTNWVYARLPSVAAGTGMTIDTNTVVSRTVYTATVDTNEIASRTWVNEMLAAGDIYYVSTNLDTNGFDTNTHALIKTSPIPVPFVRSYPGVTNGQYLGSTITTNLVLILQAPVSVQSYLTRDGGASLSIQPEIYYTYDKTNLLGDFVGSTKSITTGTNLYDWTVTFPTVTATNATGFYVVRRFKVVSQVGNPGLTLSGGTNTPSHLHILVTGSGSGTGGTDYITNNAGLGTNITLYGTTTASGFTFEDGEMQSGTNLLLSYDAPWWSISSPGDSTNPIKWNATNGAVEIPTLTVSNNITYLVNTNTAGTDTVFYLDMTKAMQELRITNVGLAGVTFHTTNRAAGLTTTLRIRQTATNSLPFTFNSGWSNFVGIAPTHLATNVWGMLSISCWGSDETNVLAGYAVQPY